jgi:hypothetical protein
MDLAGAEKSFTILQMRLWTTCLVGLLASALAACNGGGDMPGANQEAKETGENPLTAPVDYLDAVSKAKSSTEATLAKTQIRQAIQTFQAENGKFPMNLDELIEDGYLRALPKAPYHTRFAYDKASGTIDIVADQ